MQITQGIRVVVVGGGGLLAHVLSLAPSFSLVAGGKCVCVCVLCKHTCGYVTCGAASCGSCVCALHCVVYACVCRRVAK